MEQTETKRSLIFEIHDVSPKLQWPADAPGQCVGKRSGIRTVHIARSPDCTEADVDDMKERFENDWKEWHGIELPANALRFSLR